MGRRPINRVKCPRCKKIGTLRLKNKYSIVVSHYDRVKAISRRGKGMRRHYIGSLRYDIDKILTPFQDQLVQPDHVDFKAALKRLKNSFVDKHVEKVVSDTKLSRFIELINELRVIKHKHTIKVEKQDRQWYLRCTHCQQPFLMHATFTGVKSKYSVILYHRPIFDAPNREYLQPQTDN